MHVIEVEHLTKEYRLGALQGLKQTLLNAGARLSGRPVQEPPLFKALDDVSFSIEQGEVVGIIGHNGAGKSTLLKMLARISTPTRGSVKVNGRIAPLIEVGAGFVPDFTGRENVYLNGSILGLSKKEIDRKFDEIVDFAEMAEFIDTPVKRYSSGMQVKLAFAVATSIEAEILIVDEVLAVGDLAFQRKCFDRMEQLIRQQQRTVLLVSHNIRQVERICSRCIVMDHGSVLIDGGSIEACDLFYARSDKKVMAQAEGRGSRVIESDELEFESLFFIDQSGNPLTQITGNQTTRVSLRFKAIRKIQNPTFGIGIQTPDFLNLATQNTESALRIESIEPGHHEVVCEFSDLPFLPGIYSLRAGVTEGSAARTIFYGENLSHFQIVKDQSEILLTSARDGFIQLNATWNICSQSSIQDGDLN